MSLNSAENRLTLHFLRTTTIDRKERRKQLMQSSDQKWQRFRLWRKQRPFWGAILMIIAGLFVLWGPLSLFPLMFITGGSIHEGLLVGSLLVLMGILQLLAPSHALITGSIGIILSLASVLVALGGMGIGVFLGLIGSSLGVAWKPSVSTVYPKTQDFTCL